MWILGFARVSASRVKRSLHLMCMVEDLGSGRWTEPPSGLKHGSGAVVESAASEDPLRLKLSL